LETVAVKTLNAAQNTRTSKKIYAAIQVLLSTTHKRAQLTACKTSGYATMVHGRGCNPHRCTTAFANLEITSL